MATKKSTKTEAVESVAVDVIKEPKVLVASEPVNTYQIPTLNSKYQIGKLEPNVPYEIVDEFNSTLNGKFYKIYTGEYVSAIGNITVS